MSSGRVAQPIRLTACQHALLEAIVRKTTARQSLVMRARIVLLAHTGLHNDEIASLLGLQDDTVSLWRRRALKATTNSENSCWIARNRCASLENTTCLSFNRTPRHCRVMSVQFSRPTFYTVCNGLLALDCNLSRPFAELLRRHCGKVGVVASIALLPPGAGDLTLEDCGKTGMVASIAHG